MSSSSIKDFLSGSGMLVCYILKGYSTFFFFLEIGSFYHSPRVKQLSFTVFESIQAIF